MLSNLNIWTYLSKDKLSTEEKNPEVNNVENDSEEINVPTSNVSDKANEWGAYLLEAGKTATNLAAKQVTTTAKQLRQNVSEMNIIERSNLISNFSNEQMKFKSEKRFIEKKKNEISLPWIDALNCNENDEQNLKTKILSVSSDERNFTRNPPAGSDFEFNCSLFTPVALLLLKEDPKLAEMRFKLVPKKIKEEMFWKNYFYRISLIKQSLQSNSDNKESETEKINVEVSDNNCTNYNKVKDICIDTVDNIVHKEEPDVEIQQLKKSMVNSGSFINQKGNDNEDWEAELQKELYEFELVNEDNGKELNDLEEKVDFDDIEKEIMNELEK